MKYNEKIIRVAALSLVCASVLLFFREKGDSFSSGKTAHSFDPFEKHAAPAYIKSPLKKPGVKPGERSNVKMVENFLSLPLIFRKNMGQWNPDVLFCGMTSGASVAFKKNGLAFCASREDETAKHAVSPKENQEDVYEYLQWDMTFSGARSSVKIYAEGEEDSRTNYIFGQDASKWVMNVPDYRRLRYDGIYKNVDLRYYGLQNNQLKYDFVVNPGGDIRDIRLSFTGIESLSLNDAGELEITTRFGVVKEAAPYSYQAAGGVSAPVAVRYEIKDDGKSFGFRVDEQYDKTLPLVIDPVSLKWSTYMKATGNNFNNYSYDVAVDASKNVYIVGKCDNTFPTTTGAAYGGSTTDAFVSKLNSSGTALVYSTYLGGSNVDGAMSVMANSNGEAYVAGYTTSTNFPTTAGVKQTAYAGGFGNDCFVTKLNSAGGIGFSTYLGGGGEDQAWSLFLASGGEIYLTGFSSSVNFPVTAGAYQTTNAMAGMNDAIIVKLNSSASTLLYSTYLGGAGQVVACPQVDCDNMFCYDNVACTNFNVLNDWGYGIWVNSSGEAYVAGTTESPEFPVTAGAKQTVFGGGTKDGFAVKLNSAGTALSYATFLGGSADDFAADVYVNGSGEAYVAGRTESGNFPTTAGVYQTSLGGTSDAFVAKLNATGTALTYSTYVGKSGWDYATGITVNTNGEAYIAGRTQSTNFPTTSNAYQAAWGGGSWDIFASVLNSTASSLLCSSLMGGNADDYMTCQLGIDITGTVDTIYINGTTHSTNFPTTTGVYQATKLNSTGDQPALFKMASCTNSVLPVELLDFKGNNNQGINILQWRTVSETNCNSFTLERSLDGNSFERVGMVSCSGTSSIPHAYEYRDDVVSFMTEDNTFYYRLRQFDYDGNYKYSGTIAIDVKARRELPYVLNVSPVPVTKELNFTFNNPSDGPLSAEIVDIVGKVVYRQDMPAVKRGISVSKVTVDFLPGGLYILRIARQGSAGGSGAKFIKE